MMLPLPGAVSAYSLMPRFLVIGGCHRISGREFQDQPIDVVRKEASQPKATYGDGFRWLNNHDNIIVFPQHSHHGHKATLFNIPARFMPSYIL